MGDDAHIPEPLRVLLTGADHVDVKTVESANSLREFIAGFASYSPPWVRALYVARWGFVRLLGMRQEGVPAARAITPEGVPMRAGERLRVFTVEAADEDRYWVAGADDTHLRACLGIVAEPLRENRRRFYVYTVVHYKNWTGTVYFNVIRPFHHLVVGRMMRAGSIFNRDRAIRGGADMDGAEQRGIRPAARGERGK